MCSAHRKKREVSQITEEPAILKMAREIYNFLEKKYADKNLSTRDVRRALRKVIDLIDFYEILYGIEETGELLYFPFEKGYKEDIFQKKEKEKKEG